MATGQVPFNNANPKGLGSIDLAQTDAEAWSSVFCLQPSTSAPLCLSTASLCITPLTSATTSATTSTATSTATSTTTGVTTSATSDESMTVTSSVLPTTTSGPDATTTIGVDQSDLSALEAYLCNGTYPERNICIKGIGCIQGPHSNQVAELAQLPGSTIGAGPSRSSPHSASKTSGVVIPTTSGNFFDTGARRPGISSLHLPLGSDTSSLDIHLKVGPIEALGDWPMVLLTIAAIGSALWYRRKYRQATQASRNGAAIANDAY